MGHADDVAGNDHEPLSLLLGGEDRGVLELAGVTVMNLEEHDRHLGGDPVTLADLCLLLVERAMAGAVRHKDAEGPFGADVGPEHAG